jgi:ApbE superfamily uncharacterized protein (UPF0280 family)
VPFSGCRRDDLTAQAYDSIHRHRHFLEQYIRIFPTFSQSLKPLPDDPMAPPIVREMLKAASTAGVGPMAAGAGAMAAFVGRDLLRFSPEVIVENGGDVFIARNSTVRVGVFAGTSPLSNKLVLTVDASRMPLGVCTSSATVGPSLSFGRADAVCVLAPSVALADAAASAIGNLVLKKDDIQRALDFGATIPGVEGIVIVFRDNLGVWGDITFA